MDLCYSTSARNQSASNPKPEILNHLPHTCISQEEPSSSQHLDLRPKPSSSQHLKLNPKPSTSQHLNLNLNPQLLSTLT